jgi:hypothetical protein
MRRPTLDLRGKRIRRGLRMRDGGNAGNIGANSVGAGLQGFYATHDYGKDGGADRRVAFLHLGRLKIPFPNIKQRRAFLYLHDVNHLVTGFDTSWGGEACLAAWELRTCSWGAKIPLWVLVSTAIAWGLVICPRRVLGGWRLGGRTRGVLSLQLGRDELLALPLDELKARLGFAGA